MATTYMNLDLPVVSVTPGPSWATLLNAAFSAVDMHTHAPGSGVRVPSAGINIDTALTFNGKDAIALRSTRYANHTASIAESGDLGCLYVVAGELYYNDGAGTPVQITSGGAVSVGSVGGINGLGGTTASVTYSSVSSTFTFLQNTNRAALLDVGSLVVRYPGAALQNAITIQAPSGVTSPYAITLPALPPSATRPLTMSSTGTLAPSEAINISGDLQLDGPGTQYLTKSGGGVLNFGTATNSNVAILVNNSTRFTFATNGDLQSAGGRITGLPLSTAASNEATSKAYVDDKFTTVPTPVNNGDAVNKAYADGIIGYTEYDVALDTNVAIPCTVRGLKARLEKNGRVSFRGGVHIAAGGTFNNPTITQSGGLPAACRPGNTSGTHNIILPIAFYSLDYLDMATAVLEIYGDGHMQLEYPGGPSFASGTHLSFDGVCYWV